MKVGILTWFFAENYGAKAQAHSLYKFLLYSGYECEFINYVPSNNAEIDWISNNNCGNIKNKWLYVIRCRIRCKRYKIYEHRYFLKSEFLKKEHIDSRKYEAIIIGSDSVLNLKHPLSRDVYWGYGISKTPFFYYAPSCEYYTPDHLLETSEVQSVKNAKYLSSRDDNTKNILEKLTGREVPIVCDPIYLVDIPYKSVKIKQKYILLYTFSHWGRYKEQIREFAQKKGLLIVSVGRYSLWADKSYDMANVEEWLGLIKGASIVMTDSFHGMAYSLKENKQFIWVARDDKHKKIEELLFNFGIMNVFPYTGEEPEKYLEEISIDYSVVNKNMNEIIDNSKKYLLEALKGIENER